jgi:hypothetical protein
MARTSPYNLELIFSRQVPAGYARLATQLP